MTGTFTHRVSIIPARARAGAPVGGHRPRSSVPVKFARLALAAAVVLAATIAMSAPARAADPVVGSKPVVVVLCNFTNHKVEPQPTSYFEHMIGEAGSGESGAFDYWRDISYGKLDLRGTIVKGWYTLAMTRDQWGALDRTAKWSKCAEKVKPEVDLSKFQQVIVVFPEARTTTTAALSATDTSIPVASTATFPTPPFKTLIQDETVNVTALDASTLTVERGTGAVAHAAGAEVLVPGDLFGFEPERTVLGGATYTLGGMVAAHDIGLTVYTHEMAHGFGIDHSRKLSTPAAAYGDCYDIGSALTCVHTFDGEGSGTAFGGSPFGGFAKGPGMTAVQLARNGWLPAGRSETFQNDACRQGTYTMAALNHPEVGGDSKLEWRIPAAREIGATTSEYYSLELRSKTLWDRGIPRDAFLLHLKGKDGNSYWVDEAGTNGAMHAGDRFVDEQRKVYVAVNAIDPAAFTGQVTLAGCKINADLSWSGDTSGDFNDFVTVGADLRVSGSTAPIPGTSVEFKLGSRGCSDKTDAAGHAQCRLRIGEHPGSVIATASFAGDTAYNSKTTQTSFTVTRQETNIGYSGALTSDFHDQFTATATLVEESGPIGGKPVTFTLGAGDSCNATTDLYGVASCSIVPTQPAGTVDMVTSFAGDDDYEPSSDTDAFVITKQETTTAYVGPTVILRAAGGVTLQGQLLEEGDPNSPIGRRELTLGLGDQSCTGSTDIDGTATCTLTFTGALGSQALSASFAGDAYYLPSSETDKSAIVFAFPDSGAFTLGDGTVGAAGSATKVTWWDDMWYAQNSLSGGVAPSSFKGFAGTIAGLPTTTPTPQCSGNWTTSGGNSPPPSSDVPSYMGVLVTSSVKKAGSTISGRFAKIVVLQVNQGYAPNAGHAGTGTIVATYCG